MKLISKILPHISIVLSFMLMTIFVVDKFNGAIGLTDNSTTKLLMFLLGLISLICAIMLIHSQRKDYRRKLAKKNEQNTVQQ